MPSLRQKVTTYFRQLSFIAEPRDSPRSSRKTEDDGNFITKYLEGRMERIFVAAPEIFNGQDPTDLPELRISTYPTGPNTITAACTGPDEGLTGIKRSKLHLSASYADDIDFIDTIQDNDCFEVRRSITTSNRNHNKFNRFGGAPRKLSNGAITPSSDQNANKTPGNRSRRNSRTGLANLAQTNKDVPNKDAGKATTTTTTATTAPKALTNKTAKDNANKSTTIVVSMVSTKTTNATNANTANDDAANDQNNRNLLNAITTTTTNTKTEVTTTSTPGKDAHETTDTTTVDGDIVTSPAPAPAQTKEASVSTTTTAAKNGINHTETIVSQATTTTKLLEDTTERLLREAVSNQASVSCHNDDSGGILVDSVAGVNNWHMETDYAYGISVSLYENNMLTKESMGNPIADCYGMVVRGDAAAMALADGVNWGDGARLAARSAVHGCLDYLDRAIFGLAHECMATSTSEVFISLLRSLWEGHGCILEVGGALSTLTIAVVLPLASDEQNGENANKYVVCACNVGDSLGYVYSQKFGVREFTQASHDITSMRDMRDALGALGPADGNKPELSNLTFSMTVIEKGDIVFITSDGVSDNFDPVVGKFAEAWTPDVKVMSSSVHTHGHQLAPKRQNKSASSIYARLHRSDTTAGTGSPPLRPPRTKKSTSPPPVASNESGPAAAPSRPKYMRSHTVIEPRRLSSAGNAPARNHLVHQHQHDHRQHHAAILPKIPRSAAGLPLVTGPQRHTLTLYRLEDMLSYGINGTFSPCTSARRLCQLLIDFVRMITSARRKTLEQRELFYKLASGPDGIKREVELNRMQHRAARKRIVDSSTFTALPGKLDHATVVAYTVGATSLATVANNSDGVLISPPCGTAPLMSREFSETNF